MIVLIVFGFWMCLVLRDMYFVVLFSLLYSLFLMIRFKKICISIVFCIVSIVSCIVLFPQRQICTSGEYTIYEIKANYCLARKDDVSIVLYGIDKPQYYDVYYVDSFNEIENLKNIHQFSFFEHMAKQSIYYYANTQKYVKSTKSLKNDIFTFVCSNLNSNYYTAVFYGIFNEDETTILMNLGLPILGVFTLFRNLLQRFLSKSKVEILLFIFGVLYGSIFTFTISLTRILIFMLGRIVFNRWEYSFSFSVLLFLILLPGYALEFVFLFPVCVLLVYHFCEDVLKRNMLIRFLLIVFSFIYFHEVDCISLLFFNVFRKVQSVFFLIGILGLLFPRTFTSLLSVYQKLLASIPTLGYHYVPSFVFIVLACIFIFRFYMDKKYKVLGVCFVILIFFSNYLNPFFNVYVIDIGQGDCTLITEPFNQSAVMIDCGGNLYRDNVKDIVYPVLQDLGISKLDALIVTHDDFDHSGGVDELSNLIEINSIITSSNQEVDVDYPFYSLLENREAKDENDKSLISYFVYDDISYLWTGDASVDVESQLLSTYNLDVDVLKLGHHGSSTSSSYEFLDALRPKVGVVCVGKKNRYNHPSTRVVRDCHELGINLLMTKDVGMIHIFSFCGVAFFNTGSGYFGILKT